MKSSRSQRYMKDRVKGLKKASPFASPFSRSFDLTDIEGLDGFWSIDYLCSDFSEKSEGVTTEKELLSDCLEALLASPTARLLVKEAAAEGWMVSISDREGYDFHLDVGEKQIVLDDNGLSMAALGRSDYFRNVLTVSLIRALRDVWQEKRHGGFDEKYGPQDILMLERVRAADCDVMTILVAWEMRSEGRGDLWRHMIGSEEGDMAMAFSGYLERDPSATFSHGALKAAFKQWYRSDDRVKACDHETLEYMDSLVREYANTNPFGSTKLTPVGIEVLSCMPDKTAYLQGEGRDVERDPFYAGLNDEINQIHLEQILYDIRAVYVQGVPFRDAALASKIFPGGEFTAEETFGEIQ
ncbi:MAG: hypothetical protein KDJ35_05055 [Alphaproteobacteria bacterium]|nr:hypothetical protein [Alphaproteobacteria bacterium]